MSVESQSRSGAVDAAPSLLRWEVGGFFERSKVAPGKTIPWPHDSVFFALARHVVTGIQKLRPSIRRIWIPEYFCPEVLQGWSGTLETALYADDPSRVEPDWASLQATKDDFVIAVNYFGVRSQEPWKRWRYSHDCILLEDHTHDPLSSWALKSTADYVFSSLRKSIPITDGAICWSPRGLPLPSPAGKALSVAIDLKLTAMSEKEDFLKGTAPYRTKAHYRDLYARGDKYLEDGPESQISDQARDYVRLGIPERWREARRQNVAGLLSCVKELQFISPLFVHWPTNNTPFTTVLIFRDRKARDSCRSYLELNNVFCPIHWIVRTEVASALSDRILSIPSDQRYDEEDMSRVARILRRWDLENGNNR